jgi:hypothetical protein
VVADYVLQSRHENAADLPRIWNSEIVTPEQLQFFEVVVKKRRRKWLWRVSTIDGDAVIEGSEGSRPAAIYNANRALFLLLLSAPYRTNSVQQSRERNPRRRYLPNLLSWREKLGP